MAIKRVGKNTTSAVAEYMCLSTDLVGGVPDITPDDDGATCYVCDTKVSFIYFGGTWYPL